MITGPTISDAQPILDSLERDKAALREESRHSDAAGAPTANLLQYLVERRVHVSLLPREYGGLGLSPIDEFEIIRASASVSGTIGWIVFQLCGNVGRVCSFFRDEEIRALFQEAGGQPIICYHDNADCGLLSNRCGREMLKGTWPYGTLAACATHFAAPYRKADGGRGCALLARTQVTLHERCGLTGLRGASTMGYSIEDPLDLSAVKTAAIGIGNVGFSKWFSTPRAPIKHSAFAVGLASGLAGTWASDSSRWSLVRRQVADMEEAMRDRIREIEGAICGDGHDPRRLLARLEEINRKLHGWLLELATFSTRAANTPAMRARIRTLQRDAETAADHIAVRTPLKEAADLLLHSRRHQALLCSQTSFRDRL